MVIIWSQFGFAALIGIGYFLYLIVNYEPTGRKKIVQEIDLIKYRKIHGEKRLKFGDRIRKPEYFGKTLTRKRYITQRVRHEVWRRDEGRYVECGAKELFEFDHIIPVSRGGSNTARNIQLLYEECNRTKANEI